MLGLRKLEVRLTLIGCCLMAQQAWAGDSVPGQPGLVELLIPTVIEIEDFGLLVDQLPTRLFTDAELFDFLDEDSPLPNPHPPASVPPVPLPATFWMLLAALGALVVRKAGKTVS